MRIFVNAKCSTSLYTFWIQFFCSFTMGCTMWHCLTTKRNVFGTVTSTLTIEKLEALQCVPFLWRRYVHWHYLNYSSWSVQCSEYMQQFTSEEFHLLRIKLFQNCQYSLLNVNTGTGKLFKTAHIMPKLPSALYGTINTPSQNTRVARKPI